TFTSGREQLILNLRLRDASSFENYFAARNREAVERLQYSVRSLSSVPHAPASWLYLWGEPGTGKTHLLEAACRAAQEQGQAPLYVPLADKADFATALLEDVEQVPLVCVDDVDAIAGDATWEAALFALYEHLRAHGGMLILAARSSPAAIGLKLADLATRLAAGLVYQLQPLSDAEKIAALRLRAQRRGLEMTEEVANYLLTRFPRDMHSLFALLDKLDTATLAAQRRLTIPFLRGLE
ncbi:MAG TPA: DnaA regulatory inactivator Hda, partial [Acidiferrobacterales bacterium]|nr:DnaA regulatory inactivator Hda [Acidiferrobacterales bacterium]